MLRVYCILDCFSYILRESRALDFRPLYIGIWDQAFELDEEGGLKYYTDGISLESFDNAGKLYGDAGRLWIGGKEAIESFLTEIGAAARSQVDHYFVALVDLFFLPYPNQSYRQRHRPHFILLNLCEDGEWQIVDPFFDWEGRIPQEVMDQALGFESNFSGIMVAADRLSFPSLESIVDQLESKMNLESNDLPSYVRNRIQLVKENKLSIRLLSSNLNQIGVFSYRKNGYTYVSSFLAEHLNFPVNELNEAIARLINEWTKVGLLAIRIGITQKQSDLERLFVKIGELDELELFIKKEIWRLYLDWKEEMRIIN
ncbi:DUF6005 family protein [Cohnella faecalis]|uniref:Butirosin biosynthesis protein H N-terminal domain-containing protein n=1 Tax=Cohnella faecalis TaxID=2315694 RepID=A0A398CDM7_9BACL|nr:DUF6005 family protein [Cohnella faecalis]RIE00813.1 hypothetical protein D3H35_26885 [Cohnella faecalis]